MAQARATPIGVMTDSRDEARLFEAMIDAAPTGFCTIGLDGRFVRVNPQFCKMLGYQAGEFTEMNFADLTHPEDREQDLAAFHAMLNGELPIYHKEKRYLCKDKSFRWVELTSSLLRDPQGQPKYFISILQDIHRRKQAEEALSASERRFKTLFQQAPFSAQLLALDGRTLQVNAAWEQLWQIPRETIENYIIKEYNVLTDPQLAAKGVTPYIQAAYAGESVVAKAILYDPKEIGLIGRARWLTAYVHPIKDASEKVVEVMLIHHDVTDRIEYEQKLKSALESAEKASRTKSTFLANMSHEIRTPLGSILGFTELLKERSLADDEFQKYLKIIHRSGQSLAQIIDDILDLSQVEAGRLRIEKSLLRPRDIVEEVLGLFQIQAKNRDLFLHLQVDPSAPPFINSDSIRLRQIIINLVGNALKFTQQGGVTVSLQSDDGDLAIVVQDSGIGIPAGDQSWLFQPFSQRDDSSTRRFGGTGLGLALSQRLASALGGEIRLAASQPGVGSTFVLTHPSLEAHLR